MSDLSPRSAKWMLGHSGEGLWILVESAGRFGGLFASEKEALKYARFESAGRPYQIARVPAPDLWTPGRAAR